MLSLQDGPIVAQLLQYLTHMFFTDIVVVLAIVLFIAAVAIELRKDRDKKMYVGGEAKTHRDESSAPVQGESPVSAQGDSHVPVVRPDAAPPVVTQEEFKTPEFKTPKKSA
ncbi:MAG: hypothetical protein ACJ763_06360 [Bdellovibrionia bacterium]